MKIVIVTVPIRAQKPMYPPVGSLVVIKALGKNGFDDVEFYDIDSNRPSFEEILEYLEDAKPDVLGISAVVSTSYRYTKRLSLAAKEILPETLIVLGGPMGASAEILLRKTGVDLVVIDEGERQIVNICRLARQTRDPAKFAGIKGLALLDADDCLVNTGYEAPIPNTGIHDFDWQDLEKASDINNYFPVVTDTDAAWNQYFGDPRAHEPHRRGKTRGYLITTKGCVSKCTFCHRWTKGIRSLPVDMVMERLEAMIERYNLGFFDLGDENFGADPRWLAEFCQKVKKYDLLWAVNTRVRGKTPEVVQMLRDAGCTLLTYGIEAGSERMLEMMEKKVSLQQNYDAVTNASQAKLFGAVALVIGMPGETPETIRETTEFCKYAQSLNPEKNPNDLSCNYAQALPGTPLYEYGRHKGLIGRDIDSEEQYLISVSDRDAHDEFTTVNFTAYPRLVCQTWRSLITVETNHHYVKTHGIDKYRSVLLNDLGYYAPDTKGRASGYYANPKRLLETSSGANSGASGDNATARLPSLLSLVAQRKWGLALITYPVAAYRFRRFLVLLTFLKNIKKFSFAYSLELLGEYLAFYMKAPFSKPRILSEYKSLRKIVNKDLGPLPGDTPAMEMLRKGR